MNNKTKIIIFRESYLESLICDIQSFGIILVSFWVAETYVGSNWLNAILTLILVFWLVTSGTRKKKIFYNVSDAVEYLEKEDD